MKINLNDNCTVVLTAEGAEHINQINKEANKQFRVSFKDTWKEGDVYRAQLWNLMELFGREMGLGLPVPFEDCSIEIQTRTLS